MSVLSIVRLVPRTQGFAPVTIQLWLDQKGMIVNRGTTFGVVGGLNPASLSILPFVFFKDGPVGKIDFGTEAAARTRYGETNFYSRPVVSGEDFTIVWDDDGEAVYKVESITSLAGSDTQEFS